MPVAEDIQPLSPEDAGGLFAPYAGERALALAVSGGPDSTALMGLAARWRASLGKGPKLHVLTVDHGLRAEAAQEARQVAAWAAALGLDHHTLRWDGPKPRANIQAAARSARYRLMADLCHRLNIGVLATAHHLEDQAETFLLRLARGSGVDGLAAMAEETAMMGVRLVRPLLYVPRARLGATLEAAGHPSIRDPSNEDTRYARVRMRALMRQMEQEGLSAERLAETARRMARARSALDAATDLLAGACARLEPAGYCRCDLEPLLAGEPEVALRLLARILTCVGGEPYPPRLARLEALYEDMKRPDFGARTLAGCRIAQAGGAITVWREEGRAGLPHMLLKPGETALWDGRFAVSAPATSGEPVLVQALGMSGWRSMRETAQPKPAAAIARTFVSFWHGDRLVCAPHIEPADAGPAPFRAEFVGAITRRDRPGGITPC